MAPRRRRTPGTGSVFPAGDHWTAQVSVRGVDGRRKYITRWRKTEALAKLALEGILGKVAIGVDPGDEMRPLDAYLVAWLRDVRPTVRPSTWRSYESHARLHISPLLGGIPISRLRPSDVRRLIADRLNAGKSPATVGLIVTTLSMALSGVVRDGVLLRNPADGVARPRIDRAPIEALQPARARQILEAVAGDVHEALYVLLLGSGLRLGEAVGLDWRDIDFDRATVRIRTGKTRAAVRTVPIPAFVVASLLAHRSRSSVVGPDEPVFRGERKAERLRPDVATHNFPALLEAAGLPRMRVHDLRHGTATLLLSRGTPMRVIADQLGHANPAITAQVYAHVIEAQQRGAIDDLDDTIGGRRLSG